jgi:hypothetical protein
MRPRSTLLLSGNLALSTCPCRGRAGGRGVSREGCGTGAQGCRGQPAGQLDDGGCMASFLWASVSQNTMTMLGPVTTKVPGN